MRTIPLFPLKLVVFPYSKYPLHIFEERYKRMIDTCLSNESGFGIVAPSDNELAKIGSYVFITKLLKKYENGEMDIVIEARSRFNIRRITSHIDGYLLAEVEEYYDTQSTANPSLLDEMEDMFEKILDKYDFELEKSFWTGYKNSKAKSFKIAEKSGLSLTQQQTLLTLQDENRRINFLINHFEKLDENISKNAGLRNIILGDGYLD